MKAILKKKVKEVYIKGLEEEQEFKVLGIRNRGTNIYLELDQFPGIEFNDKLFTVIKEEA